eukprot:2652053-Pyramimonas_sp.AAC.1
MAPQLRQGRPTAHAAPRTTQVASDLDRVSRLLPCDCASDVAGDLRLLADSEVSCSCGLGGSDRSSY